MPWNVRVDQCDHSRRPIGPKRWHVESRAMQAKAQATDYRRALAQFATGVTVVTTRDAARTPGRA